MQYFIGNSRLNLSKTRCVVSMKLNAKQFGLDADELAIFILFPLKGVIHKPYGQFFGHFWPPPSLWFILLKMHAYVPSVTGGAAYLARTRAAFPRPRQTRILCIQKQKLHSKTIYLSKIKKVHLRCAHALIIHKKYIFGLKMSS